MTVFLSRTDRATRRPAPHSGPRLSLGLLARMFDTYAQRRALSRLDPKMLKDIGIDGVAAAREAARPIWDLPDVKR